MANNRRLLIWANVIAVFAAVFGLSGAAVAWWVYQDTRDLAVKDSREAQVQEIKLSRGNDGSIYVSNQSDAAVTGLVLRLGYEPNEYRYVTLDTLRSCMFWEVTDRNLKAAGLPKVSDSGGYIGNSTSVELSLTDNRGNVWDVIEKKDFRPNGYWDTGYNTESPSGDFIKNSKPLGSKSFDEIGSSCTI